MIMNKLLTIKFIAAFMLLLGVAVNANDIASDVSISKGDYGLGFIKWYGQSSFCIDYGFTIYVDPIRIPENSKKADVILITHPHSDHMNISQIQELLGSYTYIYGTADTIANIKDSNLKVSPDQLRVIKPFEQIVEGSYEFKTIPAYTITKDTHPKENGWIGYIITIQTPRGNCNLYFAGDTNKIPEMEELRDKIDVVFLPLGQKYTMDSVDEAVAAAVEINAEIAVPIHYGNYEGTEEDAQYFVEQLDSIEGVSGVILPNLGK